MARCDVLVSADWAESNLHAPKVVLSRWVLMWAEG